ncbi:MAG: topoisomerase DNA-binding C4 zinc finger domain-containing protein [Hahellaceae bacterium]|nr:topoisomerase DNA-binding C4 zinc finger domain-containing protein [Hahellaceae bacterium]MCP5168220.1 topoisomerase DNA-binding C4 zinc finger domain-containing protein [Hahellaceae bacterium]
MQERRERGGGVKFGGCSGFPRCRFVQPAGGL